MPLSPRRLDQVESGADHGLGVDLVQPVDVFEGAGLPPDIVRQADMRVTIPMRSGVDSLNVAVTAALILYETRRQRGVEPRR